MLNWKKDVHLKKMMFNYKINIHKYATYSYLANHKLGFENTIWLTQTEREKIYQIYK